MKGVFVHRQLKNMTPLWSEADAISAYYHSV